MIENEKPLMEKPFEEFIKNHAFIIPEYQRSYSWEEKQINLFIGDILEFCDNKNGTSDSTKYYLCHYILEKPDNIDEYEIVDGQQRISTIYLFLLVCGYLREKSYINEFNFSPVSYDNEGLEELKSIFSKRDDIENDPLPQASRFWQL
jgi:uncharacterized protein with ParB-like and HNH nuclease domain